MDKWHIITDSSCDIFDFKEKYDNIDYTSVPFVFDIDGKQYVDDDKLNISEFIAAMKASKKPSRSACPSPQTWFELFQQGGKIFAITISKELSGSYNSANTARHMMLEKDPDSQIYIINARSTGPALIIVVDYLLKLIQEGFDFDTITKKVEEYIDHCYTVFALCSFDNLVKNGRVGKLSGFIAGRLNLWGIGIGTREGKIEVTAKVRGKVRAVKAIIDEAKQRGVLPDRCIISHCLNLEAAEAVKEKFLEYSPETEIVIYDTRGLDTFYAEHQGIVVTYHI
ncbi:MAG: DegV family protein [Erysipelotrichaceae bacterium]|nr:DegV family protein [Erysipelotrichaceae bacterium]